MKRAAILMMVMVVALAGMVTAALPAAGQNGPDGVVYVDASATGADDGTSWEDAYDTLWEGMSGADLGDEVWVAAGTYYPDEGGPSTDNDRLATFDLLTQRSYYGGFAGFETVREQRDWAANPTVLSGELQQDGDRTNNAYRVTYAGSAGVVLDGFTITGGYANVTGAWEGKGGGMLMIENDGPLTIANCAFYDNYAIYGGGIYNDGSVPVLVDCTFEANEATYGAGMYNNYMGDASLTGCSFVGNWASHGGGGMYNDMSSPTLEGCTFVANQAASGTYTGCGGGMYNHQSSPSLANCILRGNYANDHGGGMGNNDGASPAVTGTTFEGNRAQAGGGMYNKEESDPQVSGCTFTGNWVSDSGGGMSNYDDADPQVSDCTFTGNWAGSDGGGMCNWDQSDPQVGNCTFTGNYAKYYGGGMYNYYYASPQVSDCTFTGNWVGADGGGMYNEDKAHSQVSGCTFEANAAVYGGGVYNVDSSPSLGNCTFAYNTAEYDGAGLCNGSGTDAALGNCSFYGNSAGRYGGGVYNKRLITVTDCLFQGNRAEVGGGMSLYSDQCSGKVTNCVFWGNRASGDGGGLWVGEQSEATVTNCSFHANSAGLGEFDLGGALYVDGLSVATAVNCIMWGDCPDEIFTELTASVTYCDVQGGWGVPADCNIAADPMWAHPGAGDFHLLAGSPCIDVGDNAALSIPEYDFEGDDRVIDGNDDETATVDMGVDEAKPATAETFYDGFEDGTLGKWVQDPQNDWFNSGQWARDGARSAEVDGMAADAALSMAQSIDLQGAWDATLSFSWLIESGLDSGEYLALDLWDGGDWVEVARLEGNVDAENVWHDEVIEIAPQFFVSDFNLQFRGKMSLSLEDALIDEVMIIAAVP